VAGIFSSVELADIAAYDATPDISNCIGGTSVFDKLSTQRDWIESAFASVGESPTLEGLTPPGAAGESCAVDAECISGICASSPSTRFCSARCEDGACPDDMQCIGEPGSRLCVPMRALAPGESSGGCAIARANSRGAPSVVLAWLALSLLVRRRHRFHHHHSLARFEPFTREHP
jgi:hypothetical protein